MKKSQIIICFFLIIALAGGGYVYSQWTSYHNFAGRCMDCHLKVPAPGEPPGTFTQDITSMCEGCHADALDLSHPVDRKPTMQVPAIFPLDWKGDITCVTCHPVHQPGFGPFHLRTEAQGEGLCVLCHDDLEAEMHKVALGTAHGDSSTGANLVPGMIGSTLDALSLKCMACHDATFATDTIVENKSAFGFFHNNNEIGLSHPIGISYIEAKRLYKGAYRDTKDLPPEIKLFAGVVGCGSCHNPYSQLHSELVMSNEGSRLCLACHVK